MIRFENSRIINTIIYRRSRLMHNRKQKRNHSNTKYFLVVRNSNSQLFFLISKFIRTRDICFSSNLWNSFEHEIFVSRLIWFQHFCFDRIEMIWKIIIVVIFASDRLELIETNYSKQIVLIAKFLLSKR